MPKWKETHPLFENPNYQADYRQVQFPVIIEPAVLRSIVDGYTPVRCACGKEFEYLQDQVNCPKCGRFFDKEEAEDLTGGEDA